MSRFLLTRDMEAAVGLLFATAAFAEFGFFKAFYIKAGCGESLPIVAQRAVKTGQGWADENRPL